MVYQPGKISQVHDIHHNIRFGLYLSFKLNSSLLLMHKSSLLVPLTLILALSCADHASTIHPAVENITESVYASGIIKSKDQYEVFSTVNGLLEEKLVSEGELVRRNQPIIRLYNLGTRLKDHNARVDVEQ